MDLNSTSTKFNGASQLQRTPRTEVKRARQRGSYERSDAYRILDEGLVCHVGFVTPEGEPVVIPTAYGRDGDRLLIHGARGNRMLRSLAAGGEVCVTVTLLDGIVFGRTTLHMSMNYRSVVIFGRASPIEDGEEHRRALDRIVEHVAPGHGAVARPPTAKELAATLVLALPVEEASVKLRAGGPLDEEDDLRLPIWGGSLPLRLVAGPPTPDPHAVAAGLAVPATVTGYTRPGW